MGTDLFSQLRSFVEKINLSPCFTCFLFVFLLAVAGCAAVQSDAPTPSGAGRPDPGKAVPGELIVMFAPDTPDQRKLEIHQAAGGQVLGELLDGRIAHVKVQQGQPTEELAAGYRRFPEVESVEPNYVLEPMAGERQ
jgi:hypothetical protein